MKNIKQVIFLGVLIMFLAEVVSSASQMWVFSVWAILITFPLYLAHTLFFLYIAKKYNKFSFYNLYFFGIIFGLYEAWITKVLWSGYMGSTGPGMGKILGIAVAEFPILVFFWHPLMSFIFPLLIFQIITGSYIEEHKSLLVKTKRKTKIINIFIVLIASFITFGSQFNILNINISLLSTLLLIFLFQRKLIKVDINTIIPNKRGFIIITIYLVLLYLITFIGLLPENIPNSLLPFLSVIFFYILSIKSISLIDPIKEKQTDINTFYNKRDLMKFFTVLFISSNIYVFIQPITSIVFTLTYILLSIIGIILFIKSLIYVYKNKKNKKITSN